MLVLVCGAAATLSGAAQGAAPPASRAQADALFQQALVAFYAGKMEEAYAKFAAAWVLKKTYDIAGDLGIVELELGKPRDAAEHLTYALDSFPPTAKSAQRAVLESKLEEARMQIGTLSITVDTPGAEVYVDGKLIGTAPLEDPVFLDPGSHVVEARSDGYPPARAPIDAKVGVAQPVVLALTQPKAPPIGGGTEPDRPTVPEKRSPVPAIVAGGLAVGAAAVGVGLFAAYQGKLDHVLALSDSIVHHDHRHCVGPGPLDTRCTELMSTARDADTFNHVAVGTFVGAGVVAAGALTYLLWPAAKAKKASIDVHAAPVLGAGRGGLILSGAF